MTTMVERTDTYLPVYEVAGAGISEAEAGNLARHLKIPPDGLRWRDGVAAFVDPEKYLAVPRLRVTDRGAVSKLREATKNEHPDIPIEVFAIDHAALRGHAPFSQDAAMKSFTGALRAAGLEPERATPVAGHTLFTTVTIDADSGAETVLETKLDTHISYRFTLDGYLLAGPGAQLQISYGPDGEATRLHHSVRRLKQGPAVRIIPAETIKRRFSERLSGDGEVNLRLIYWAPPLANAITAQPWNPGAILPWYAVSVSRKVADPSRRETRRQNSRVHLVPATEDARYVPSVRLAAATPERSRIEAEAQVSGGTPPYTFLWAGSNPETGASRGRSISYTPLVRDFREVLPAQSLERTENVTVTVVDGNGISAFASQSVQVTARPAPRSHNSVTYGCESPNDPGPSGDGTYAPERIAWQQGMGANGQGGGAQRFCWLADDSWPGDFIEPPKPGALEPSPWINGDADYSNWGINSANIVLYNGDGNPWGFSEMYPGATPYDYNTGSGAGLSAPGSGTTVQIGAQGYAVNYNGAWGAPHANDHLQWLAMYACQILEYDSSSGTPWSRWGAAFDGLHALLGFETTASDNGVGFMLDFPAAILEYVNMPLFGYFPIPPLTVVQGWLSTAISNNMGTPAAMGPIHNIQQDGQTLSICDFYDYYWGKGPVGPNIAKSQINGWWYIQGSDAMQDFP